MAADNPIASFLDAMRSAGIETDYMPQGTGEIERFHDSIDKAGSKNGWLILHLDGIPASVFGNWKNGVSETWCAKPDKAMTQAERDANRARMETARKMREAERVKVRDTAALKCVELLTVAAPVKADHPYIIKKSVKPYGAKQLGEALIIPISIDGKVASMQFIDASGGKKFKTGGAVAGGRLVIGNLRGATLILLCEGWATGCTLHEATGLTVIVCFNAGNLLAVAKAARAKFPDMVLVLCADDDVATPGNPGIIKATEAAQAVAGLVAIPDFGEDRPDGATDFNDLAAWCGLEAVKGCVDAALNGPPVAQEAHQPADPAPSTPAPADDACEATASDLHDAVARLSSLPSLEYEKVREAEAQRLGVRVGALDKEISIARRTRQEEGGKAAMFPTVEVWPHPVNGAALLDELLAVMGRFIVCEPQTAVAASLWCAFTWLVDSVEVAPLAVITAPEKRCGKSQLLNLIGRVSRRPLVASNISLAATFRVIEAHAPTLLIDEADSFFKENEELRGVINSGHTRQSAYVIRTVGDDHEPRQFSTWGAKAISGIGHLAETLMDRAVILELRRKLPSEKVQRLRHAEPGLFDRLAAKLARFAEDAGAAIERARPALPEALNDRAQDNWEPLLAIADHAGGEWPQLARHAALKISGVEQEPVSLSAELLADIREVFEHKRLDRISTVELLQALTDDDLKPWATYNRGKPISPRQLAKRLDEYGIQPRSVRIGFATPKGFMASWFDDAFSRYLTPPTDTPATSATPQQNRATLTTTGVSAVAEGVACCGNTKPEETPEAPPLLGCCGVADKSGVSGGERVAVEI